MPDTGHPDVPPLVIINVQVPHLISLPRSLPLIARPQQFPREEQSILASGDGPGASVVFYLGISDHTRKELKG